MRTYVVDWCNANIENIENIIENIENGTWKKRWRG